MNESSLRRFVLAALCLAMLTPLGRAGAEECRSSCTSGQRLCTMEARINLLACVRGCDASDSQCASACAQAYRDSRSTCRATNSDCRTTCPRTAQAPSAESPSCAGACGATARACFGGGHTSGRACAAGCITGDGGMNGGCMKECAAAIGAQQATCLAALQNCLADCQPPVSGTCFSTVDMQCTAEPCGPTTPCAQANEFCSERCAAPPPSGTCFDRSTGVCAVQTCSPTQPCADAGQACVHECPPPGPKQKCFDTTTKQCTDRECDATHPCEAENQTCTLQCPPPPPKGTCFDTSAMQCLDQACSREQPCAQDNQRCVPECPPPTPVPPCSSVPCGGPCAFTGNCSAGSDCAEHAIRGQCASDDAGNCACVPVTPPPTPTRRPTPPSPCDAAACGGPCTVSSCPPGAPCEDAHKFLGQCSVTASGSCECVPAMPSPKPTPTAQCSNVPCGGPCALSPNCPTGSVCAENAQRGQCATDDAGTCSCVPVSPPPTPTRKPTPASPCEAAACGGSCIVSSCPPGVQCAAPDWLGQCTVTASGSCECVRVRPSPPPTATPQCGGAGMCGGACELGVSACPPGVPCDGNHGERRGQCALDDAGNCRCAPASPPPTRTPAAPPHPCDAAACGGRCALPFPCPDGSLCPAAGPSAVRLGECRQTANGGCDCVPLKD